MTRKHYILLAEALRQVRPASLTQSSAYAQWRIDVSAIMGALAGDNPRFDPERFLEAVSA